MPRMTSLASSQEAKEQNFLRMASSFRSAKHQVPNIENPSTAIVTDRGWLSFRLQHEGAYLSLSPPPPPHFLPPRLLLPSLDNPRTNGQVLIRLNNILASSHNSLFSRVKKQRRAKENYCIVTHLLFVSVRLVLFSLSKPKIELNPCNERK